MLAPRSRGKGGRRFPGRDGGYGKAKAVPPWRKRAQHCVASLAELPEATAQLVMRGSYGDALEDMIYKFDQCMAKMHLKYYGECSGWRHHWCLNIWVCADVEPAVREIITRITSR